MATKRTGAEPAVRYRIVAAEAHSWSSLLLEDERGERYLYAAGTKSLTTLAGDTADALIASRAYRTWRGERSWALLDQLPVFKQATGLSQSAELPVSFSAESQQGDAQPS